MTRRSFLFLGPVLLSAAIAHAEPPAEALPTTQKPAEAKACCEKMLRVRLSQTHFSLNPFTHLKDSMNAVELTIPVACSFWEQVKVGDNLLTKTFRWGSFVTDGSIGDWSLEVVGK